MNLRRPWDKLADCMWLARFVDKARLHLAGALNEDFEPYFGHALATDGAFLKHFGLTLEDCVAAVRIHGSDDDAVELHDLAADILLDAPALGDPAVVDTGTYIGFVAVDGDTLLVSVVAATGDAALFRLTLQDSGANLTVGSVEALVLPSVQQTTNLVVRGERAYMPTAPFGLLVVSLGETLALTEEGRAVGDDGSADDVAFIAVDGVRTTGFLMGVRDDGVAGLFDLSGTTAIGAPASVDTANALVAMHTFAVVSNRQEGAVSLLNDVAGGDVAFVPALEVPNASQAEDTRSTVRGLVVSDSAGGVLRVVLR